MPHSCPSCGLDIIATAGLAACPGCGAAIRTAPALTGRSSRTAHDAVHGPIGLGDVALVTLHGELDLATEPTLREAVERAVGSGVTTLVFDLTAVDFVDSAILHRLVRAHHRLLASGGGVALVGVRPAVRRVLGLTALDTILPLHATRADAFAAVQGLADVVAAADAGRP